MAEGQNYAYIAIDLDNFKQVNDVYGHWVGDRVIMSVSNILREVYGCLLYTSTYKITYKTNGGELADGTAKKYNVDTRTFKLKTPVRYGYTFKGWYKDKKCTRRVTQVKKGTIGNLTFYAKWQINKYKIKYDGNGATRGSMKGVSVCQYGKTYTLTKNKFKRTGYVLSLIHISNCSAVSMSRRRVRSR